MRQRYFTALVLAGLWGLALNAHATLIGDEIFLSGTGTLNNGAGEILIVDDGVETTIMDNRITVDVGIDTIELFASGGLGVEFFPGDFLLFEDLDVFALGGAIVGLNVMEFGIVGNTLVDFGADWVFIDFNNTVWNAGVASMTIQLFTEAVSISEPTTLALLGLGVSGLWLRRRSRKVASSQS